MIIPLHINVITAMLTCEL